MLEKKLMINGTEINYKHFIPDRTNPSWSASLPILILHWWWWSSDTWSKVWEMLSSLWNNVYIPDLPGFGKSSIDKVYNIETYSDLVKNLVKALNIDNLVLIWHSNWWRISILLASEQMLNISKLILAWSAWIRHKPSFIQKTFKCIATILKPFSEMPWIKQLRVVFYKLVWWRDYLNCDNKFIKQTFINVLNTDLRDEMKNIRQETSLIWWDKDTYTPLSDWYIMRDLIKGSSLDIIKWARHWIHLTDPERLVKTIINKIW